MVSAYDFDESKYTQAAWSLVQALSSAASFHQSSSVDSPLLLDLALNPSKHETGEAAESAQAVVTTLLTQAGANVPQLKTELEQYLQRQPRVVQGGQPVMGQTLAKVLETARIGQKVLSDSFVSTEALLLALVKEDSQFTRDALLQQGVTYQAVLDVVKQAREKTGPTISRSAETMYDALVKYGIDFTEKAEKGQLDPVIGRDDEIRRAVQILSRRTKNNPVLIGDPVRTIV